MNDSEANEMPGAKHKPNSSVRVDANKPGIASLSEWAEFSFLIQKLDGEYAETLDYPLESALVNPKPTET